MANQILDKMSGFKVGPKNNPFKKGIWIWSKPIYIESSDSYMIILDTDGLNYTSRDYILDA